MASDSPVTEFYNGKNILVTGCTGIVGKVLVEKIIREFPKIDTVYVLLRPKDGKEPDVRLAELIKYLKSQLFGQLRVNREEALFKIIPVKGNIALPGLGLSDADTEMLIENVNVVFHLAVSNIFYTCLKRAVLVNVMAPKRILELCRKMKNLQAVIFKSSVYGNCDRSEVREEFYPPPEAYGNLISVLGTMDCEAVRQLTPAIVVDRPNIFIYTTAIAEHLIKKEAGDLPVAIVRPSIVGASWKEPIPGWVDAIRPLTNLMISIGKGWMHSFYCKGSLNIDIIPVDVLSNTIIVAAWRTATHKHIEPVIYNCTSGLQQPLTWEELRCYSMSSLKRSCFDDVVWYPHVSFESSKWINKVKVIYKHLAPAYARDMALRLTGHKPRMVKISKRILRDLAELEFFTTNEWTFYNDNFETLETELSSSDKKKFYLNMTRLDWPIYVKRYLRGIKYYTLNEDYKTMPKALEHLNKLWWLRFLWHAFLILMCILAASLTSREFYGYFFDSD